MTADDIEALANACGILADVLEDSGKITGPELVAIIQEATRNPVAGIAILTREARARGIDLAIVADSMAEALANVDPACERDLTNAEQGQFLIAYTKAIQQTKQGMTLPEAAKYLGITRSAVLAAIGKGKIRARKPRGRWILDPKSVEDYQVRHKTV